MIKSPFIILKDLLSPLECENLLSTLDIDEPNRLTDGKPIKTILSVPVFQNRLWNRMENYFDFIENYYNVNILEIANVELEWYPESAQDEVPRCENSIYSNNDWRIINDFDFTMILFLKDYNNSTDFDIDFECYGGRLEMSNHGFSFNPTRGTAIIFPSNQYFINRTETPTYGDCFQIRTHLICDKRFEYNKTDFEGNYKVWFDKLT